MDDKISRTTIILFTLMLTLSVDGAILSYQDRHDDRASPRPLQKISIKQARQLLYRQRRATPTAADSDSHRMLSQEVVLDGTEDHTQAYVHWSGKLESEDVFILTLKVNSSGVVDSQTWRSTDYGSTYKKMSFDGALISYFFVSPANHTKMVFTDVKNHLIYTSTDKMNSKPKKSSLPVASDDIRMHKENSDWMLLYDYFQRKLYVTMDFGSTWTMLGSDVNPRFFWGRKGYDHQSNVVHMEVQPVDSEQAYYKRCTIPLCNSVGDGIDYNLGPFMAQTMLLYNEYIWVQKSNLDGTDSHMMVSYKRQSFTHTYFPDNIKTKDFLVLDANEGQVFIAVNHGDRNGVSLYLSDPTGRYYVLSLSNVNHLSASYWFDVDFHHVQGLNGVFLANQRMNNSRKRLKTLVTFDKGGNWLDIPSPQKNCTSDSCALLLRLDASFRNDWILSEEKAPGFIIAHGHFGRNYDHDWRNLTVFTSMDGGYRWDKSDLKGAYHFNILDQGSLVTAIKTGNQEPTNVVHYSYDEGKTWQLDTFGDKKLTVDGVLNEPGINTLVASIYGHVNTKAAWTMIKLNFTQVLDRACRNDTDYSPWMPSDHDESYHENCILGQKILYWRRKRDSKCRNGEDFERRVTNTTCQCHEEDYECDFGYSKSGNRCTQDSWYDDSYIAPRCIANQTFERSRGYRKVGSDKCVGNSNSTANFQPNASAICPLVAPAHMLLVANVTKVATGKPVNLHLFQKRGSTHNSTTYVWSLNVTRNMTFIGLAAAQSQHINFTKPGVYSISVAASNSRGKNSSNTLSIRVEEPVHTVGIFCAWAAKVGFPVYIGASTNVRSSNPDGSLHYLYQFGDEKPGTKDMLTWDSEILHTYNTSGTYNLFITAVNSVSAITKQAVIKVVDDGVMLELGFSNFKIFHGNHFHMVLQIVRHELCQMLGLNLDRLSVNIIPNDTAHLQVLVLPSPPGAPAEEMTTKQIVQTFFDMVQNKTFYLFRSMGLPKSHGEISVTSVKVLEDKSDGGNKKTGANYRAVYIAIPIVLLAAIVTLLVLVYYRRRFNNIRRYTMVNQHEETDALLDDDEDEPPLDLRSDTRDDGRHDDSMLDLGSGSHLVMVTGTGGGDGAENC